MQQVDQYETQDELLMNRIRLRKYLRELLMNQKRVMETIAKQGLDARNDINNNELRVI